jgi:hypothetical protein
MATKAEKEQLIEVLKFTPRTYNIYIGGYGGESYAGTVDPAVYEYFKENKIDIEEYANDWNNLFSDVPSELQPFGSGSPYDCDNLFHASGAELSSLNEIVINDEAGNQHWACAAGIDDLEHEGVVVNETGGCNFDDLSEDTVVHWGGQGEKGTFFDGEIYLKQPFDPKKLTVNYENCDGWWLINSVEYDGEEIDGSGGYSTTGKWSENKWILGNGNEAYDSVSREDQEEEDDDNNADVGAWPEVPEMPDLPVTDWYPVEVKPVHKGEYEVDLGSLVAWPFMRIVRAEWTGRKWKDSEGESIKGIVAWRGLAEDPITMLTAQFDNKEQ